METLACQTRILFPRSFTSRSCLNIEQSKVVKLKKLDKRLPTLSVKKALRRSILQLVILNPIYLYAYTVIAAPMMEIKEPDVIRTLRLPSGVRIQEIVEGEGPEANEGDLVEVNYVCRRSNGYFVHSTVDQFSGESAPVILPLDDKQI